MSELDSANDRNISDRLEAIASRLGALSRANVSANWSPGLRRAAGPSDLLRALDGSWSPTGPVADDPWSVPNGFPEGAERWSTRDNARRWLGVERAATLRDVIPDRVGGVPAAAGPAPVNGRMRLDDVGAAADLITAGTAGRPVGIHARHWLPRSPGIGRAWLELTTITNQIGSDGLRGTVLVCCFWELVDGVPTLHQAHAGRDGLLLIAPTGSTASNGVDLVDGLAAFVHLAGTRSNRGAHDVLLLRWKARLLETYRSRLASGSEQPPATLGVGGRDRSGPLVFSTVSPSDTATPDTPTSDTPAPGTSASSRQGPPTS